MIERAELDKWISEAVKNFMSVMPAIDRPYPEIFMASKNTFIMIKWLINRKITLTRSNFEMTSFVRYLHGKSGDAIIILSDRVPDSMSEFTERFYFELGIFYAVRSEQPQRIELCGEYDENDVFDGNFDDDDKLDNFVGYHVWIPFVASIISDRVADDEIKLERDIFVPDYFSEYELARYFVWAIENRESLEFLNKQLEDIVLDALDFLERLLNRERFWIADDENLINLGQIYFNIDVARIDYYFKQIKDVERRKELSARQKVKKKTRKAQRQARKKNRK